MVALMIGKTFPVGRFLLSLFHLVIINAPFESSPINATEKLRRKLESNWLTADLNFFLLSNGFISKT